MYSHSVSNEAVIGKDSTDKRVSVFCRNLISIMYLCLPKYISSFNRTHRSYFLYFRFVTVFLMISILNTDTN